MQIFDTISNPANPMYQIDFWYDQFLKLSHQPILMSLMFLGLIFVDFKYFKNVIYLIGLSLIFNLVLRSYFKVPLVAWLNKPGFAFPSGHMQNASLIYSAIAFRYSKTWLNYLLGSVLFGIGICLVQKGYHNLIEVAAGFAIGFGLAHLTQTTKFHNNIEKWFPLLFALLIAGIELQNHKFINVWFEAKAWTIFWIGNFVYTNRVNITKFIKCKR